MAKMDTRHERMVLAGNNKAKHVTSVSREVDSRRQVYTPIQIPRPSYSLERRPSLDMGVIARMRSQNVSSATPFVAFHTPHSHVTQTPSSNNPSSTTSSLVAMSSVTQQTSISTSSNQTDSSEKSPLFRHHVITQMSLPRKQTTNSTATRLVHPVTEIKPILKGSRRKDTEAPETVTTAEESRKARKLDPKFCYRLPDKPDAAKFRKSVSFKEDVFSSKINRRHMTSPVLSLPYSVLKADDRDRKQIFV